MSYKKKLALGTFQTLSSSVMKRFLALLIAVIFARLLGPQNLGIYSIFQNIHSIFGSSLQNISTHSIVKYTAEYKKTNKIALEKFLSTAIIFTFSLSLGISLLYFYSSDIIANKIYGEPIIALLMKISSVTLILSVFINFGGGVLQGLQKIKQLAMLGVVTTAISIPITYFFILKMGLVGVAISGVISAIITTFLYLYFTLKYFKLENIKLQFKLRKKYVIDLINYSLPIFVGGIILRPARLYGQTLLVLKQDFTEVGYFKVAFGLYNLMMFIPTALSVPLIPMVSEIHVSNEGKPSDAYSKILKILILIILPLSIGVALLSKYIILVLYGEKYLGAILITYILIISAFFGSITSTIESLFLGTGRTLNLLYIAIFQALMFVLSAYILITEYGTLGLGMAFLVVDVTLLPIYSYFAIKKSLISLNTLKLPIVLSVFFLSFSYIIQKYIFGVQLIIVMILYLSVILLIEYIILEDDEKKMVGRLLRYVH